VVHPFLSIPFKTLTTGLRKETWPRIILFNGVGRFAIDKGSAIVAVTFSDTFSVTVTAAPQVWLLDFRCCCYRGLSLIVLVFLVFRDGTGGAWISAGNSRQLPPFCRPGVYTILIVICSNDIKNTVSFSLVRTNIVKDEVASPSSNTLIPRLTLRCTSVTSATDGSTVLKL
jgi:hypothetical protein